MTTTAPPSKTTVPSKSTATVPETTSTAVPKTTSAAVTKTTSTAAPKTTGPPAPKKATTLAGHVKDVGDNVLAGAEDTEPVARVDRSLEKRVDHVSAEQGAAKGKAARLAVPRSLHAAWRPHPGAAAQSTSSPSRAPAGSRTSSPSATGA